MITIDPVKKAELDNKKAEKDERKSLKDDLKVDEVFTQLARATPAQINTFVNNAFNNFTVQQRKVIKMLVQVAATVVRDQE
jgi:hypothetical protein